MSVVKLCITVSQKWLAISSDLGVIMENVNIGIQLGIKIHVIVCLPGQISYIGKFWFSIYRNCPKEVKFRVIIIILLNIVIRF